MSVCVVPQGVPVGHMTFPVRADYDPLGGNIYWVDHGQSAILSSNVDGTQHRVLLQYNAGKHS